MKWLDRLGRRKWLDRLDGEVSGRLERGIALGAALIFAALFCVDTNRTQPLIQGENFHQFPFYGTSRGAGLGGELTKVFDICAVDDCLYRSRPVNFLLELIDVKAMMALNAWFPWGFRSLVRIGLLLAACFFLARATRALAPRAPPEFAWAVGAFFAVSGQALASGVVDGRPSKLLAAVAAAAFFDAWLRLKRVRSGLWFAYLAFACFAVLGDEQVLLVLALLAGFTILRGKLREGRPFLALAVAAGAFYIVFRSTLGLWAVQAYSSGSPVLSYADPRAFVSMDWPLVDRVLHVWLFQIGMLFGSVMDWPEWGVPAFLALVVLLAVSRGPARRARWSWVPAVGLIPMIYLLAQRHPPILEHDLRRVSYFLASAVVLLASFLLLAEQRGLLARRGSRAALVAILLAMGLSSFRAQDITKSIAVSGNLALFQAENLKLWAALRDPNAAIPDMVRDGHAFVLFARGFVRPGG